jgi:hypothetical protein
MLDRRTAIAALWALAGLIVLAAGPVSAKEGGEARLDVAIPRDAEPGSTLDVGWSTFLIVDGVEQPIYGTPVYIRLVSPDGTHTTEVRGTEQPSGSGHYVASIVVPDGGIGEVVVAMIGEACTDARCERSDFVFRLTDDPLVTGAAAAAAPPAPVASSVAGPAAAATRADATTATGGLALLIGVGVMAALAAGIGALVIGRVRHPRADPAGH